MKPILLLALGLTPLLAAPDHIPAGYTLETIQIPDGIILAAGGLAFRPNGDLMICTREGEVWRYRDGDWNLFADGLHEPLGIVIDEKSGDLYVMQRPELTRLIDENGDGTADIYQTVSANWGLTDNYHEYAFGPVRDADGNFYGTLNTTLSWPNWSGSDRWDIGRVHGGAMGRAAPYRGWSFRVSPDGTFTPWSSGLRSPAGIGMNLEGDIFYTDNQGDWNGTSTLHHIVKDRFHGHPSSLMDHPDFQGKDLNEIPVEKYAEMRTLPALLLPHGDLSNSPGEPTVDSTAGKFGPFAGQFFIGDQTRSNLMRASLEKVGGEYQGVVFNFIHPLQSGCIRGAFAPDGSLYVGQTGRGWRSVGPAIFGLQRVVWDGKTAPVEMQNVNLTRSGFRITFTAPVDREKAANPATYQIRHWHYLYGPAYGGAKLDQTDLTPTRVNVSPDGLTAELELPLVAEKLYRITLRDLSSQDGRPFTNPTAWYTLNRLKE
jgi:hypothetical protein